MSDGKIGAIYECLLAVALKSLQDDNLISGILFWNENPAGVDVEPDLMLGQDVDHPSVVFCVSHSASAKESDKKNWRNLGELCEIKTAISPPPKVVNVFFESYIKSELKDVQDSAFDAQLLVDAQPYSAKFTRWIDRNSRDLPTEKTLIFEALLALLTSDKQLSSFVDGLKRDVLRTVRKENGELNVLWKSEQNRVKGTAPKPKHTTVRRGVSKLLIFEDLTTALRLYKGARVLPNDLPDYVYRLGLARRTIGRAVQSDDDIRGAVRVLNHEQITYLYEVGSRLPTLIDMIRKVRSIELMTYIGTYIKRHYADICEHKKLLRMLLDIYQDPNLAGCPNTPKTWPPKDVWLATYLIELIKLTSNRANGFGVSQIGQEIVASGYGGKHDLSDAGQFAGGFGLPAWLQRKKTSFRPDLVEGLSFILSEHVRSIGLPRLSEAIDSGILSTSAINNVVETKICTYRMFDPLAEIIKLAVPGVEPFVCQSCFAEYAHAQGSAGRITALRYGNIVIKCQSANHLKHSTDKRKELCGRAVGIRYSWDDTACKFKLRDGVSRLILLLDGVWSQNHLNSLSFAGWDEIYYPDEIDKLKASVLGTGKKGGVLPRVKKTYGLDEDESVDFATAATPEEGKEKRYGRTK